MTPLALRLRVGLLLLVGSHAGCAWLGWTLRDRSADLAVASAQAAQQASRADTAQAAHQQDLANAGAKWRNAEVVVDGNVITSRKPDDIPAFSEAVVKALVA
ncbi:hypothetical protein G6F58_013605 [Rhizopus delemar]|nr:hypothetical protein G6F58_013605 [Rhizopus delemar]